MADKKQLIVEDDMSANAPVPQAWRDDVAAQNAAARNMIVVPPTPAPALPKGREVGQEKSSSKVYMKAFKKGGAVRGCGCAVKGKTKGTMR